MYSVLQFDLSRKAIWMSLKAFHIEFYQVEESQNLISAHFIMISCNPLPLILCLYLSHSFTFMYNHHHQSPFLFLFFFFYYLTKVAWAPLPYFLYYSLIHISKQLLIFSLSPFLFSPLRHLVCPVKTHLGSSRCILIYLIVSFVALTPWLILLLVHCGLSTGRGFPSPIRRRFLSLVCVEMICAWFFFFIFCTPSPLNCLLSATFFILIDFDWFHPPLSLFPILCFSRSPFLSFVLFLMYFFNILLNVEHCSNWKKWYPLTFSL